MAIAVGVSASASSNATTITTGAITTQATGSIFVVLVAVVGTVAAPTDSKGNTYTPINSAFAGLVQVRLYYCENGTGGASHTFSHTPASGAPGAIFAMEITGGLTSSSLDQTTAWLLDSASPYTTNTTGTTTQADELAVVYYTDDRGGTTNTMSWGNGYTVVTELKDPSFITGGMGAKVLSATGTQQGSMTVTSSSSADGIIVTFMAAGGGGGGGGTSVYYLRA